MNRIILLLVGLAVSIAVAAISFGASEAIADSWEKIHGDPYAYDYGTSIDVTADKGYIITGYQLLYGAFLLKTDAAGTETWSMMYNGVNTAYSVQQTSDGGYIVTGSSQYGLMLLKVDVIAMKVFLKDREYDEPSGTGYSVKQTSDGGYIVAGVSISDEKDVLLLKTDGNGEMEWKKTFGQTSFPDEGFCVDQTKDGGYIIAGRTTSYGAVNSDVCLIKTDAQGNEQWYKTYGGTNADYGKSVEQTSDGGYIIAGWTASFGNGGGDVYLIKTDGNGNEVWSWTFGGTLEDRGESVQQTQDGGYVVAGFTSLDTFTTNAYLIKTDKDGRFVWEKNFGGLSNTEAQSVKQTESGGYVLAGTIRTASDSDVYLIYCPPPPPPPPPKVPPKPAISIQGTTDKYIVVTPDQPVYFTVSVKAGDYSRVPCEYWLCYVIPPSFFLPRKVLPYEDIIDFNFSWIKPSYFPEGLYILYFAIDTSPDDKFSPSWGDGVLVISKST